MSVYEVTTPITARYLMRKNKTSLLLFIEQFNVKVPENEATLRELSKAEIASKIMAAMRAEPKA